MRSLTPGIIINGCKISETDIDAEVQYHPAGSLTEAQHAAKRSLVIRELLLQRATEAGYLSASRQDNIKDLDQIIDNLLESEIKIPEADEATCLRYYENNQKKFLTSPIFDVSHILYLAPPEQAKVRAEALERANLALTRLRAEPGLFEQLARSESACSSASAGGHLGQISHGQTMLAFESALLQMQEGELSKEPVATSVGYHIIRVNKRAEGQQLPFSAVATWIKEYLNEQCWNRAFHQYVTLLAGRAQISGYNFEAANSPLVQ